MLEPQAIVYTDAFRPPARCCSKVRRDEAFLSVNADSLCVLPLASSRRRDDLSLAVAPERPAEFAE